MDDLLNTKQAAEYCHMNPRNITEAVKDGRLHPVTQDKRRPYWFTSDEVARFQDSRPEYLKNKTPVKSTAAPSSVVSLSALSVDPELEDLIAPLTTAEFQQLADSCSAEGIRDPILVWNYTIVDGHNRFRIAQNLGLDTVPVKAMTFKSRDDAKRWIVQNQLGRRNVTPYERCRLALLLKDSVAAAANQRMLAGKTDPTQISAEGTTGETRDTLAKLAGVSHDTLHKVEVLEAEADDDLKDKLRAGNISINKAWTILYPKKSKTISQPTTTLDTSGESVDTFPAHTFPPVDNDTTPDVSEVVPPEPQASVSAQSSDDEISDTEASHKDVIEFIKKDLGALSSTLLQFVSNNNFYCDEEVLTNDWSRSFTALVPEEFSKAFWQKFQQARKNHSLTKVVVLIQLGNNIDIPCFNALLWVFSKYRVDIPFHVLVFDFTEEANVTT